MGRKTNYHHPLKINIAPTLQILPLVLPDFIFWPYIVQARLDRALCYMV